jgi:hypothetical protein
METKRLNVPRSRLVWRSFWRSKLGQDGRRTIRSLPFIPALWSPRTVAPPGTTCRLQKTRTSPPTSNNGWTHNRRCRRTRSRCEPVLPHPLLLMWRA